MGDRYCTRQRNASQTLTSVRTRTLQSTAMKAEQHATDGRTDIIRVTVTVLTPRTRREASECEDRQFM
jgi:hypothetical protein